MVLEKKISVFLSCFSFHIMANFLMFTKSSLLTKCHTKQIPNYLMGNLSSRMILWKKCFLACFTTYSTLSSLQQAHSVSISLTLWGEKIYLTGFLSDSGLSERANVCYICTMFIRAKSDIAHGIVKLKYVVHSFPPFLKMDFQIYNKRGITKSFSTCIIFILVLPTKCTSLK